MIEQYTISLTERNFKMIKAIILDGYSPKDVIVKFEKNYTCVPLTYFLNSLCKRHISDYDVKTIHL